MAKESWHPPSESLGHSVPEEDQDSVSVSESALVVVTAQLGLGSQGQHVGVVRDDTAGSVQIPHCRPELLDLNITMLSSFI